MNPVTLHGVKQRDSTEEVNLSIGRMHVGRSSVPDGQNKAEEVKKYVVCVLWSDANEPIGEVLFDEDHFVRGLLHLFPKGELNS